MHSNPCVHTGVRELQFSSVQCVCCERAFSRLPVIELIHIIRTLLYFMTPFALTMQMRFTLGRASTWRDDCHHSTRPTPISAQCRLYAQYCRNAITRWPFQYTANYTALLRHGHIRTGTSARRGWANCIHSCFERLKRKILKKTLELVFRRTFGT